MISTQPIRAVAAVDRDSDPPGLLDYWSSEIAEAFARGAAGVLERGRLLCRARRNLMRGQWSQLWRSGQVKLNKRTAEMYVTVGAELGELNAHDHAHLPSALNTLYCSHLGKVQAAFNLKTGITSANL